MAAYVHDTNYFQGRSVVLFIIIAFHVFVAWALATGLARHAIEAIAPPIQTEIVQEEIKKATPPPPPPPTFERPPVEVPPPEVTIDLPVEQAATTAITAVAAKAGTAAPKGPTGVIVPPKLGKNFPNSEDYYPAASKRLGEEGSPTVHVCVGPSGKLSGEPSIKQSSGSARLDEGAMNLVKAGRYQPGTEDGKPIEACFDFRIKFQLTK